MIIDAHCHLENDETLEQIIQNAQSVGVGLMLNVGTRKTELDAMLATLEYSPLIYGAYAIHPESCAEDLSWTEDSYAKIYDHPKVIGIGETGLDYHYNSDTADIQKRAFKRHIALSQQTGLPLIIHTRDAEQDTLDLLVEGWEEKPFPCMLHSFNASYAFMKKCLDMGFYFSLSGILTFKNAESLREIVKQIPSDRVFTETDSPYLAPVPFRGRRNEPMYVKEVLKTLAELHHQSLEKTEEQVYENFMRLFGKKIKNES